MGNAREARDRSRTQFGANADRYATSVVHARGASLERLVELVDPEPDWRGLDIATAAGHTAFAFAPRVGSVAATDLTPEMIELASRRARELGHRNVTTQIADAEALPFAARSFDFATCRIAPHHFPEPRRFVAEAARVLGAGGVFGFVDNVVPDDDPGDVLARTYNDWERDRDPSHVRAISLAEWTELFTDAGFEIRASETASKRMTFRLWVENMQVPEERRPELLRRLLDPSTGLARFLDPTGTSADDATFALLEGLLVAVRR